MIWADYIPDKPITEGTFTAQCRFSLEKSVGQTDTLHSPNTVRPALKAANSKSELYFVRSCTDIYFEATKL